jgi:hypothetical protein
MLEVVRRQAADRRRRHRLLTATASVGVVVAVAVGAAAMAGDGGQREIRVAGGVSTGGATSRSGGTEGAGGAQGLAGPTTTHDPSVLAEPDPGTAVTITAPATTLPSRGQVEPSAPGGSGLTTPPTTTGSTAAPGPDTPVSGPVMPPPTGPLPGPVPQRVSVSNNAVDLRPRPFESAVPLSDTSVGVRFWGGVEPCDVVGDVDVVETPTSITITLYTGREAGPQQACIAIAAYKEVVVHLGAPLAGRTVIDGAA